MAEQHNPTDPEVIELERKARELTRLLFILSEKRITAHHGMSTLELTALGASAISLQKAIVAFLAIEKLCE
ncbi:hypothetical protein LJC36_01620 [Desulfovibrio sp. OttesenSCG-928-C14]|nr:hypothetical protein [Desulfovibrio sp. OttesenSCG-928-C14]